MAEIDGLVGVANEEIRKFRPRKIGGGSGLLALFATLGIFAWLLLAFIDIEWLELPLLDSLEAIKVWLLVASFILALFAVVSIIYDKLRRCPPPSWFVIDELKMFLSSEGLLPDDATLWKSYLRIRKPKFDQKASCLTVWFYVRSAKATEESFAKVKDGQAFRYAQDVEVKKHLDRRGRWDGYDLRIWYRPEDDVFNQLFEKVKP